MRGFYRHVIELIPGIWPREEGDFYSRIEQTARDHLAKLGRYLEERHVARREEVIFGSRAHEIVRYAVEIGVDLIVLSSHRIGVGAEHNLSHTAQDFACGACYQRT